MDVTPGKSSTGLEENIAGGLGALIWIVGLIFFLIEKDSKFVKFYGFQGFILGLCSLLSPIPVIGWIWGVVILVFWVISWINAFQGKLYKVPVIGNIAMKQAGLE